MADFAGFKSLVCSAFYSPWSVPAWSPLSDCLHLRVSERYLQECSTLSCSILKFARDSERLRVDHRSLLSRWSWHLKTNMRLWYHLICSTPLSSKISFIPPSVSARPPPSEPDLFPPSMPFEVKACVEAESECKPLLWCNRTPQQVVWSCFGPEKLLKKKKKMEASHELRGSGNQLYLQWPLSFFIFILTYSLIFSLNPDFGFSSKL